MEAQKLNHYSLKEYLDLEIETGKKYEYHDGYLYAMAGGSLNHGLICGNIFGEIRSSLKEKNSACKVINSEIKLHIEARNSFVYPDTMVICDDIKKSKLEPNSVVNPILIIEVLSKSTANYDRGDKFHLYRQIPTLKEYILIEQDSHQIDSYNRKSDLWKITRVEGIDANLKIESLNIIIPFKEIYRDTES